MIGQDPSKRGVWYEESYVVLQLLRLLNEEVESVQWEGVHEDGQGIDCWLTEEGVRVAVQCKTREGRSWSISDLGRKRNRGRSILGDAKAQLEDGRAERFRFVSDSRCPKLIDLIEKAVTADSREKWSRSIDQDVLERLMEIWELAPNSESQVEMAYELIKRIELQFKEPGGIREYSATVTGFLSPSDPAKLLHFLSYFARSSLTKELRASDVRSAVQSAGIEIQPRALEPWTHDRLDEIASSFVQSVIEVRGMDLISRGETEDILKKIRASPPYSSILVHGPTGTGKSEVIASVVEALRNEHTPLLALRPDMDSNEIGLGDDPIVTLQHFAAGGPAVVVMDQLDQILSSGEKVQKRLKRCRRWLRQARRAGFTIVVGCRTVDAEKELQLSALVSGSPSGRPEKVFVGDLDEPTVTSILASKGVAADDLSPQTRVLAKRPLFLRLLINLLDAGASLGDLRSQIGIVDRWWAVLSERLPGCSAARAGQALDQIISRMESDGLLSVPADGLDHVAVDALCTAGVLGRHLRGNVPHVRPVHQIITDVRMAQRWSDVRTFADLVQRIGKHDAQSLHQARRLHLTVPLLIDRPGGIRLLDEVLRSSLVRPLLKRAVLLGIAAIDRPNDELVSAVRRWIDDKSLSAHILDTVVRRNVPMIEALSKNGWFDDAWRRAATGEALRERLIGLLGSVAEFWGDGVANHLSEWSKDDPTIIDQAHRMLTHQPGNDTDALFQLRKAYIAHNAAGAMRVSWKKLLEHHPDRAFELLAILLERASSDDLIGGGPAWAQGFPQSNELPPSSFLADHGSWALFLSWWQALPGDLLKKSGYKIKESSLLTRLVELMSRSLVGQLASDPETWKTISNRLFADPQDLDAWLLLRAGANLPPDATKAADILASWLTSNPHWVHLRIGIRGSSAKMRLARDFVARIGEDVTEHAFVELERWLLEYRDEWTVPKEQERPEFLPTAFGVTAYQLLGELPGPRLSSMARRRLGELQRKFDGKLFDFIGEPRGGHITSAIPDHVADAWSLREWTRQIRKAESENRSSISATWHERGERVVGVFTLGQLTAQLERLAAADPRRYADLARAFDKETPAEARKAVLTGIAHSQPPDHYARSKPWEGLDDEDLAEILVRPEYLDEQESGRRLAWIIDKRSRYEWPDPVIARLAAIARGPTSAGMTLTDDFGLLGYRMNETACSALHSLGRIAQHQPVRRAEVLALAESLIDHEDPGRRAGAAFAALSCYENDPPTVATIVLEATAEPRIAAESDLMGPLIWLTTRSDDAHVREIALDRLLAMAESSDEHIAERGGRAAGALRIHKAIDEETLEKVLDRSTSVRKGAAREVGELLRRERSPDWILDLALRLADDPDEKVADFVVLGIVRGPNDQLILNPEFFSRLLDTNGGTGNLSSIIDWCDRASQLLPVADQVLDLAMKAVQPPEDGKMYWHHYERSRRAVNALARLVEEAEQESRFDLRTRALDAWDALIEAGEPVAFDVFDRRVKVA